MYFNKKNDYLYPEIFYAKSINLFSYEELKKCTKQTFTQDQKIINCSFEYLIFNYMKRQIYSFPIFEFDHLKKNLTNVNFKSEENSKKMQIYNSFFKTPNIFLVKPQNASRNLISFLLKPFFLRKKEQATFLSIQFLKIFLPLMEKERLECRFFDFYIRTVQKKLKYEEIPHSLKKLEDLILSFEYIWVSRLFYLIGLCFFEYLQTLNHNENINNKLLNYYKIKQLLRSFWIVYFKAIFFDFDTNFNSKSMVYKFPLLAFINSQNLTFNSEPGQFAENSIPLLFNKNSLNLLKQKTTQRTLINCTHSINLYDFLSIRSLKTFGTKTQNLMFKKDLQSKSESFLSDKSVVLDCKTIKIHKSLFDFLKKNCLENSKKIKPIQTKAKAMKKKLKFSLKIPLKFFKLILRNLDLTRNLNTIINRATTYFSINIFRLVQKKAYLVKNQTNKKTKKFIEIFEKIINEWRILNLQIVKSLLVQPFIFFDRKFLVYFFFVFSWERFGEKELFNHSFLTEQHLLKIKTILKTFSTKTQTYVINILTPKLYALAYRYRFSNFLKLRNSRNIDHAINLMLWRWSLRRHNNKAKYWIKTKYFYWLHEKNWIFGNFSIIRNNFKNSQKLIYLPSHFQILFFLRQHWYKKLVKSKNAF